MSHVTFGASGGALTALRSANQSFNASQKAVATGRKVDDAADNPALYAVAAQMRSESGGYAAIGDALGLGKATVSLGRAAAEKVVGALSDIKSHILAASAPGAHTGAIQSDIDSLKDQVGSLIGGASFAGANLLRGVSGDSYDVYVGGSGQSGRIAVANQALQGPGGSGGSLEALTGLNVGSFESREQALEAIDGMIGAAVDAAAALGSAERRVDGHSEALSDLARSVNSGISALVDTDLEEESARMAADGAQKALATEMQAIANAQSKNVLKLFENLA